MPRAAAAGGTRGGGEDTARRKRRTATDAAAAWPMHAATGTAGYGRIGCGPSTSSNHALLERDASRLQQRIIPPLPLPSHLLAHRCHRGCRRGRTATTLVRGTLVRVTLQPRCRAAWPRRTRRTRRAGRVAATTLLQAATGLQRVGPRLLRRALGRLRPERRPSVPLAFEACRGPGLLRAAGRMHWHLLPRRRRRRTPA